MSDVVVIGGGVIGMVSARCLAMRGAHVTLLERGCVGAESSWAGGGIISALIPWRSADEINQLIMWGHHHYPLLAQELVDETGIDVQWHQSGMAVLVADTDAALEWSKGAGLEAEVLTKAEAAGRMPGVRLQNEADSAIYLPEVRQIRSPRLIQALLLSLRSLGVEIHQHCLVEKIERRGKRISTVKAAKQNFCADNVVVTTGAWAAQFMPELQHKGIKPIRGEMLLYKVPADLLSSIVVAEDGYLIPRRDGYILCGSTVEDAGFDCSTTTTALAKLSLCAERLLPGLQEMPIVGHWAGLRPGSDNGVPVISRSAEYENLYVSCGHFRNGIAMAPASAQIVSDLVEGVEPRINSTPYSLV